MLDTFMINSLSPLIPSRVALTFVFPGTTPLKTPFFKEVVAPDSESLSLMDLEFAEDLELDFVAASSLLIIASMFSFYLFIFDKFSFIDL